MTTPKLTPASIDLIVTSGAVTICHDDNDVEQVRALDAFQRDLNALCRAAMKRAPGLRFTPVSWGATYVPTTSDAEG